MKKSLKIVASAALVIAVLALAWFFLVAPRLKPPTAPPKAPPTAPTAAQLSDDKYSALSLYLASPGSAPSNLARVELTLTKVEITRNDGHIFTVSDQGVRVMLQKDTAMKVVNDLVPAGPYGKLKLHFAPTGTLVTDTGAAQIIFLPIQDVEVSLEADLPTSRTLAALTRIDLSSRLGAQNGVATFTLPAKLEAETYVLGGIFRNSRSVGNAWSLPNATLVTAVKQDLNLDIASKAGLTGTTDFVPAAAAPNPVAPAVKP
jgi:hypothetical protein